MGADLPSRDPGLPRFTRLLVALALIGAGVLVFRSFGPDLVVPEGLGARPAPEAETASGASLFVAEGCGTCHVTVGPSTALNPSLAGIAETAQDRIGSPDYTGQAESPEGYVREAVVDHCAYVVPGYTCEGAPDVGVRLGEEQVQALVDFLWQLD